MAVSGIIGTFLGVRSPGTAYVLLHHYMGEIDGASRWQHLRHITLPLMLPTIAVTFVFRMILAFKVFDEIYLLTGGGPGTSTEVISFTIYRRFFTEDQTGYGAAMSIAVIAVIAAGIIAATRATAGKGAKA